jgi:hypothetical protein
MSPSFILEPTIEEKNNSRKKGFLEELVTKKYEDEHCYAYRCLSTCI